ncbi:MAG: hypothetical protein Q7O66_05915 [Dehalococcoidia bacterium]|nr:hypothetical protein [Dehalococcoidia bacterium]
MSTIVIDIPHEIYKRLQEEAREEARHRTTREVLQASGRLRPLSETLRRKIIPGVTLDEVRASLAKAGGPPLSEILLRQRRAKR